MVFADAKEVQIRCFGRLALGDDVANHLRMGQRIALGVLADVAKGFGADLRQEKFAAHQ
ncbi:hypothetical protein D3C74_435530 [compost metagenome]